MLPPLLRTNPNFRRFFIGQSVSLLGDQITTIALPLTAVLALRRDPGPDGRAGDRVPGAEPDPLAALPAPGSTGAAGRRNVMLATDIGRALLIGSIPVAYAFGHLDLGSAVHRRVPHRLAERLLLRRVRRDDPDARAARAVRPGELAARTAAAPSRSWRATASAASSSSCCAGRTRSRSTRPRSSGRRCSSAACSIDEPPGAPHESGGLTAGARWIRANPIIRAELLGVATLNFFNFIFFALFLLYATRHLHVSPAALGLVLGVASVGTLSGSFVTARIGRRIGVGRTFALGCFLFPAPLILVPLAAGPHWLVLTLLFVSEFVSGIGLMLLDIMAGTISAGLVPPTLRSRVSGAFMVVNYGVRPLGTTVGGILGTAIGLRPTLWIATVGALAGLLFILPSPIMSLHDVPAEAPE